MRLLETTTLQMHEFFSSDSIPNFARQQLAGSVADARKIPKYTILSHVWGPEEISFQDITGDRSLAKQKIGWAKVKASCSQACRDGHAYIWIDTCCIDKTSSTELSEAINSMYKWYRDSEICYVFLSDVDRLYRRSEDYPFDNTDPFRNEDIYSLHYSRWFSRGWTLQELLAPPKLQFFNAKWKSIGSKKRHLEAISTITGIDLFALNGGDLRRLSIARRMTWAANRQTTRSEDMAYCLLGIFNINMPLLYGEGANAYIRLQEEILKISDDQSLFAWKDPSAIPYRDDYPEASQPQGLLASSPSVFQFSETVAQFYSEGPGRAVSASTNKGLQVEFLMCQDLSYPSGLIFLAVLNCHIGNFPGVLPGIRLRRLGHDSEQYARIDVTHLLEISSCNSESELMYQGFDPIKPQKQLKDKHSNNIFHNWIVQTIFIRQETQIPLLPGFWVMPSNQSSTDADIKVVGAYPPHLWDPKTRVMQPELDLKQGTRKLGALLVEFHNVNCILIFGVTYWELTPWCEIVPTELSTFRLDVNTYGEWHDKDEENRKLLMEQYRDENELANSLKKKWKAGLKDAFKTFQVKDVKLPADMETREHQFVCDTLKLTSIVQFRKISGKEIYLINLHRLDDDQMETR